MLSPAEMSDYLTRTSRTFALAIPLLESPLDSQVGLAYLLFRVADTLEDATLWPRDRRLEALASLSTWLEQGAPAQARFLELTAESPPVEDASCVELTLRSADLLASIAALEPRAAKAIRAHARRTTEGMASFVARQDERGAITLRDVQDLRDYCYVVAGIVGELSTELFALADAGAARARGRLAEDAVAFGEGLQLVNILKDEGSDAVEGRVYLPVDVARSEIESLARADLARAVRYVESLADAGARPSTVAFCELPVRLATATLDARGRGAQKLPREDAMRIWEEVTKRRGGA